MRQPGILGGVEQPGQQNSHETRLRVRYAETDQMGVVYYANYYIWMEIGRVEFVRSRGVSYREVEEQEELFLAVIHSECRYLAPARYDQEIVIETSIASANARVVEFVYEIRSAERVLAKGSTRHMWLNREWRPANLPEKYLAALLSESKDDLVRKAARKRRRRTTGLAH